MAARALRLLRLAETIRRLSPSQVANRAVRPFRERRAPSRLPPFAWAGPPPPPPESVRPLSRPFDGPEDGVWRFAGRAVPAVDGGPDWRPDSFPSRLAVFHAHYLDWLAALAASGDLPAAAREFARWREARAAFLPDADHAYVRSRRVIALVAARALGLEGARGPGEVDAEIARDADTVHRRPEWDVRGNHLVANGAALVVAGHALRGRAASRWRVRGAGILTSCARLQVAGDGLHHERSPTYHALVLEHFLRALDACAASGDAPPAGVEEAARRMAVALAETVLPDGEPLRWRDGAPGRARPPAGRRARGARGAGPRAPPGPRAGAPRRPGPGGGGPRPPPGGPRPGGRAAAPGLALPHAGLLAWGARRGGAPARVRRGSRAFPDSGLAIVETPDGRSAATLLAAPACPPDVPGHGHADANAYEAVLDGVRVVASAGTSDYAAGPARDAARRPGAFAGVSVDGVAPADPYDAFRVGARGWVRRFATGREGDAAWAAATSGGFARTVGARIVHRRVIGLAPGPVLVVLDEWAGEGRHEISVHLPLAPGCAAVAEGDSVRVRGPRPGPDAGEWEWRATALGAECAVGTGRHARALGDEVERPVAVATWRADLPARLVHAWTPGPSRASLRATAVACGFVRVDLAWGGPDTALERTLFLPSGRAP